ncbi:hypothetical protein EVAR_97923_1 [Eumeta japonica]|uniref:Uncharacterized protein n=1 Tax=Eumeta variegata TaxID=151549 RepID=A0A4C1XYL3_EUMVA|nr:hypothetical protein EVAR_97923_1 [Eumeta japonica]
MGLNYAIPKKFAEDTLVEENRNEYLCRILKLTEDAYDDVCGCCLRINEVFGFSVNDISVEVRVLARDVLHTVLALQPRLSACGLFDLRMNLEFGQLVPPQHNPGQSQNIEILRLEGLVLGESFIWNFGETTLKILLDPVDLLQLHHYQFLNLEKSED